MTPKQLMEYIIDNEGIDMSEGCGCPPDYKMITCDSDNNNDSFTACKDCWADFLRNRYKKYKG